MKPKLITVALFLTFAPLAGVLAAPIQQTLKFSTTVPPDDFTIEPSTPWPGNGEVTTLKYDKVADKFDIYSNNLSILSTAQDVTAKLQSAVELSNGNEKLQGVVTIGKTLLTTSAQLIHPKAAGTEIHPLFIGINPMQNPAAGTYTGDIVLIFDGV